MIPQLHHNGNGPQPWGWAGEVRRVPEAYKVDPEAMYHQMGKSPGLDGLVCNAYRGEPLNPSVLSHNLHVMTDKACLSGVRFHDLRPSFASIMLMKGAPAKVISECLGHASVAFTMDVYSHLLQGMQKDAMSLIDEVLPDGVISSGLVVGVDESKRG